MAKSAKAKKVEHEDESEGVSLFDGEEDVVPVVNDRWASLRKVASEVRSFRHAPLVLNRVRSVSTIFPQFDHATKVAGYPIERFSTLHGESASGKTYFSIGLLLSFLMQDHLAVLIDAERTTPVDWVNQAMGEYAQHPFFFAERPTTYEETRLKVREFCKMVKKFRDSGKVKQDTSAIIVLDSIRKLVPKDQWDTIMKEAREAAAAGEKFRDRTAQHKAFANAAWLDELVPLLDETKTSMLVIARETEDPNAPKQPGKFAAKPKKIVGGGKALRYDSSLDLETERVGFYGKKDKVNGETRLSPYGEKYRVNITKSKVAGKGDTFKTSFEFHISNGVLVPEGFDRGRDLVEFARSIDVVEGTSWLKFGSKKFRTDHQLVQRIAKDMGLFQDIETACREFITRKAEERTS